MTLLSTLRVDRLGCLVASRLSGCAVRICGLQCKCNAPVALRRLSPTVLHPPCCIVHPLSSIQYQVVAPCDAGGKANLASNV
jgi:hypothetical protein